MRKHIRALVFLFSANIISGFAQGITMLAIPWFLVSEWGEADGKFLNTVMVGSITFVSVFWGIYAGTIIDRYNRKRIFQILTLSDATILLSVAAYGFTYGQIGFAGMALIYGTTVFTYNVHYPNLYAFVQELFEPSYYAKVNSTLEVVGQTTSFLGMMLGGMFISGSPEAAFWPEILTFRPWSLHEIFLLDGITYFIAFCLLSAIPYIPSDSKRVDRGAVWQRIRQGWAYLADHKPLLVFGLASYLVFFSLLILIQVVMPIYVNDHLQANALVLAYFKGFYALGAVLAGVLGMSLWVGKTHLVRQIIFLLLLAGSFYFILAITKSVAITLGGAILLGLSNGGTRILRITYIVRIVPNRVIGRVNSLFSIMNVLMRVSFISILTLPFFTGPQSGGNISYAFILLGIILFSGAFMLIFRFPTFDHSAALQK